MDGRAPGFIQKTRAIVMVHREQARSYSELKGDHPRL
jgi:hypothetical protein